MKRWTLFIIGFAFAIIIAAAWFAKPRTLKQQFYMAGIRLNDEGFLRSYGLTKFHYSAKIGNESTILDVLNRAGFVKVFGAPASRFDTKIFERKSRLFFWQEPDTLAIARTRDALEISSSQRL